MQGISLEETEINDPSIPGLFFPRRAVNAIIDFNVFSAVI